MPSIILDFLRQSFVDILITSLKDYISTNSSYTGANYDAEDIAFAFHSNYIAGWGYDENQEQV